MHYTLQNYQLCKQIYQIYLLRFLVYIKRLVTSSFIEYSGARCNRYFSKYSFVVEIKHDRENKESVLCLYNRFRRQNVLTYILLCYNIWYNLIATLFGEIQCCHDCIEKIILYNLCIVTKKETTIYKWHSTIRRPLNVNYLSVHILDLNFVYFCFVRLLSNLENHFLRREI